MSSRSHERRTERATAEEVAEIERQLWEFAKRIDPPSVPEAKLRPGAFLWRIHRTWHDLGRGTGGLASRSFRALKEELLQRDPPVRGLQPKLYGNTALSQSEASQLIDVILETWHLERSRAGKWQARPIMHPEDSKSAGGHDLETIRENLLQTLLKGDDHLLLEEPVGVPPEVFFEERGRSSQALILPTKGETTAHFSPSNAYGGFSNGIQKFFLSSLSQFEDGKSLPFIIWVLRLKPARNNAEFHQSFHSLAIYSACITNWYLRMSKKPESKDKRLWDIILKQSGFAVHGLSKIDIQGEEKYKKAEHTDVDDNITDLGPEFFLPDDLPIVLKQHHQVKKHRGHDYGLNVSVEHIPDGLRAIDGSLRYWLFPDHPRSDLEETAETTGLPIFDAEMSPGQDFDLAFTTLYEAVAHHLGIFDCNRSLRSLNTLAKMGWKIFTIQEFQRALIVSEHL